jgi:hypothetical protein
MKGHSSALMLLTALGIACGTPAGTNTPATTGTQAGSTALPPLAGRSSVVGGNPAVASSTPRAGSPATPGNNSNNLPPPSAAGRSAPGTGQAGTVASAAGGPAAPTGGMPAAANGGGAAPPPAGDWGTSDPAKPGPFMTTTENMVGPGMAFTMVRPAEMKRRHPVITWGNGTGTTPPTYRAMLELYASHGFIVIASNSMNVGQGTPPPMLDGVTWVLEQDMASGSSLFEKVDRDHIGATGHSQGAFAASSAGADERIKTVAPIQVLGGGRGLHGPALGLCGTMDTVVACSGNLRGYMAVSNQPAMYAELKAADHTNWIFSPSGAHPYAIITNAWFRVHLMGDTALRPLFYGADCTYCKDDAWVIMRKMMD